MASGKPGAVHAYFFTPFIMAAWTIISGLSAQALATSSAVMSIEPLAILSDDMLPEPDPLVVSLAVPLDVALPDFMVAESDLPEVELSDFIMLPEFDPPDVLLPVLDVVAPPDIEPSDFMEPEPDPLDVELSDFIELPELDPPDESLAMPDDDAPVDVELSDFMEPSDDELPDFMVSSAPPVFMPLCMEFNASVCALLSMAVKSAQLISSDIANAGNAKTLDRTVVASSFFIMISVGFLF